MTVLATGTAPRGSPAGTTNRLSLVSPAAVLCCLTLAACVPLAEQGSAPTPTAPVPVLVIVTPTVGLPASPLAPAGGVYVVETGDTLSGIAEKFGIGEDALAEANGLTDRHRLMAGQELVIPVPTVAPP